MDYAPVDLNDGWHINNNFGSLKLNTLNDSLDNQEFSKIDGLMIVLNDTIVFEKYLNGWNSFLLHEVRSASKSLTSLLLGKAIDLKLIDSEHEAISSFFPNSHTNLTLNHLLNMRSGLDCDDTNPNSAGHELNMWYSKDYYDFVLKLDKKHEPGEFFSYCSAGMNLIGGVINKVTHDSLAHFAESHLLNQLDIEDYNWYTNTHNYKPYMGGGLFMNLRDFSKLGVLINNNGSWKGKQVISKSWIEKIRKERRLLNRPEFEKYNLEYSNGWWFTNVNYSDQKLPVLIASGNGGQRVMVVEDKNLVVAIFGHDYNSPHLEVVQSIEILKDYILGIGDIDNRR